MDNINESSKKDTINIKKFNRKDTRYFIAISGSKSNFEFIKDHLTYVDRVIGFGFNRVEELENMTNEELQDRLRYLYIPSNQRSILRFCDVLGSVRSVSLNIQLDTVSRNVNLTKINSRPNGDTLVKLLNIINKIVSYNNSREDIEACKIVEEFDELFKEKVKMNSPEEEFTERFNNKKSELNNLKDSLESVELVIRLITKNVEYTIKESIDPDYANRKEIAKIVDSYTNKVGDIYFIDCIDSDNREVSIPLSNIERYERI